MSSYSVDVKNITNAEVLCDPDYIKRFICETCRLLDLKIIQIFGREFEIDKGPLKGTKAFTFCAILGTSSLTIHTYPETRGAQMDIISCIPLQNKYLELCACLQKYVKTEHGQSDFIIKHQKREQFLIHLE